MTTQETNNKIDLLCTLLNNFVLTEYSKLASELSSKLPYSTTFDGAKY